MAYHFSKKVDLTFKGAIEKITAELKENGFGVLTEINIKDTLREKLDIDFRNYRILGACNPELAHQALLAEPRVGLMLPCNVIVQEHENGEVEVSAVDPVTSMQAIDNEDLKEIAGEVSYLLKKVIDSV